MCKLFYCCLYYCDIVYTLSEAVSRVTLMLSINDRIHKQQANANGYPIKLITVLVTRIRLQNMAVCVGLERTVLSYSAGSRAAVGVVSNRRLIVGSRLCK